MSERLKMLSFPVEFGQNNLLYYKSLNDTMDSLSIIANTNYIEPDLF